MKTLRQAAARAGLDQPPVSVRTLARDSSLEPPISLLAVIGELDPEQLILHTGPMKSGDISGTGAVGLLSNGWCSIKVDLKDQGKFFGDNFRLDFYIGAGDGMNIYLKGHVDAGDKLQTQADGKHSSIKNAWTTIKANPTRWHLQVDPAVGGDEVPSLVAEIAGIALLAVLLVVGGSSKCDWTQDAQGRVLLRCDDSGQQGEGGGG